MIEQLPSHIRAAIRALLREGRRMDAIKLYREHTREDLGRARDYLLGLRDEDFDLDSDSGPGSGPDTDDDAALPFAPGESDFSRPTDSGDELQDVVDHIKGGRKIEAIKAYRMVTNAGLREAKTIVEKMAREVLANNPDAQHAFDVSGGGGTVFFLLIGFVIFLVLLFLLGS